ncbi:hypothetical protein BKA65DRAFT_542243 [Rhexocercosporidium sp. MPI-PUGE-AT-0058]|nr:hypothetical protein BKA65DRAFT_542243 [Rhexocercosporidium sp. MPI-PUGE-AT-0058]
MSAFSNFKSSVKAALKVPHTGHTLRSRQQVITFNEALEALKSSQTGFVTCAAFNSFGRCRKEISLLESNFLASLDQMDLTGVQTPVKLMPLMLCSTHWGKTVYYNALFLDWLSVHGSKQDHPQFENPQFENTVVDFQSAIAVDSNESCCLNIATSSGSTPESQGRPVSAPTSSNRDQNYLEILTGVAQVQVNGDHEPTSLPEFEPDCTAQNLPEISVLVGMESYASIELGVATLEIMFQENLKCIAMTSDGWRCPTSIHKEQHVRARDLLSSYTTAGSALDIELIVGLVLCGGHSSGELPRIYSEKWSIFSKQRLPKEEAMSKFDADFWMFVQFFPDKKRADGTHRTTSFYRPRSTSHGSSRSRDENDFGSTERAGESSQTPQFKSPWESQTRMFEIASGNCSSTFRPVAIPSDKDFLKGVSSPDPSASECQPQSVPESGPINVRPVDKIPHTETTATSTSEKHDIEAISLENGDEDQDFFPEASPLLLLLQKPSQQDGRLQAQDFIDRNLIIEMNALPRKGGSVHIFWSPSRKLCKVGKATDINLRKQQIEAGCQLQDFEQVTVTSKFSKFPERVTKLVHLELQLFRAKLSCEGRHDHELDNGAVQSEHGEWFDVSEDVAIHSVLLWCDFTRRAYNSNGSIKKEWAERLKLLPKPNDVEVDLLKRIRQGDNMVNAATYHMERSHRYNRWIRGEST